MTRLSMEEARPLLLLLPLVGRATATQRWYDVLEMLLLQVQAYHLQQQQREALARLSQAVHLGAPEGYIRRFVDEGPLMAASLSQPREQEHQEEDLPYLEVLLRALNQRQEVQPTRLKSEPPPILIDPLSARELEVLHLLARGASNQEIAETLMVTTGTIKRHVSNIW